MTLREIEKINHDCNTLYIRESDGNLNRPLFTKTFISGSIPDELLDREVKHMQAGVRKINETVYGCLTIILFMK